MSVGDPGGDTVKRFDELIFLILEKNWNAPLVNKSCKQNTANLVKSHSDAPSIEI